MSIYCSNRVQTDMAGMALSIPYPFSYTMLKNCKIQTSVFLWADLPPPSFIKRISCCICLAGIAKITDFNPNKNLDDQSQDKASFFGL